jgi:glyoxylase-like metal-dependent hydrolase (beta-lactamase superfamily II)
LLAVYQLPVPTPYAVGPVNVYLIKNDPVTLIDVGPGTAKAGEVLKDMLSSLGVGIKEVKRIIITHAHPDHCGLAADIAGDSNATVFIHRLEEKNYGEAMTISKNGCPLCWKPAFPRKC